MRPLLALLALATLAGCAATKPGTVSLRLQGNEDDALVTIDDQLIGPVSRVEKKGVALPVGSHRVTIEKTGFFPYDELVEVKPGDAPISLDVKLERIPD
jgi:hypothetical protein